LLVVHVYVIVPKGIASPGIVKFCSLCVLLLDLIIFVVVLVFLRLVVLVIDDLFLVFISSIVVLIRQHLV
jgi:hypothetical protein